MKRREFLIGSSVGLASLLLPKVSSAQEPFAGAVRELDLVQPEIQWIPSFIIDNFPHLHLDQNKGVLEATGKELNLDPRLLLAVLLSESPDKIGVSSVGAIGPFQIMPKTGDFLRTVVASNPEYRKNSDLLLVKSGDLSGLNNFKISAFLAGIYLKLAGAPEGKLNLTKEEEEKTFLAAMRYHDGINRDLPEASVIGKIYAQRVLNIAVSS